MRVIAGTARSIPLLTPEGNDTRPTTDRIKETLFNMLQFDLQDCVFIDFFAGSGGIGIEALSRGAASAFFVDNGRKAADCIRKNLEKCRFTDRGQLLQTDALLAVSRLAALLPQEGRRIIFMDPPYDKGLESAVLDALLAADILREDSLVIVETSLGNKLSEAGKEGYEILRTKTYKNQKHVFLRSVL